MDLHGHFASVYWHMLHDEDIHTMWLTVFTRGQPQAELGGSRLLYQERYG